MNKFRVVMGRAIQLNVFVIGLVSVFLAACGGGNGGGGTSPPVIQAMVLSFAPGAAPASMPTAMVSVLDAATGANITNATVTVNGVPLAYNPAPTHTEYEGNVAISPGATAYLVVKTAAGTYTASGAQAISYPSISSPAAGATFITGGAIQVAWSGGAPLTNAQYLISVADAADPAGGSPVLATAPINMPGTVASVSTTGMASGTHDVMVGITTAAVVPHADPTSLLMIGGFSYVPIVVTPLPSPSNVQATGSGDGAVTLSWACCAGYTVSSYNIYWSTTAANANKTSGTKISGVKATAYTQTGLTNGVTYYYSVTVVNSSGESVESPVASVTVGAPAGVATAPGNAQATIRWPAMTGATSYNVYWSTTAASATAASGTKIANVTSPYVHAGLTNGTPYYYVVTGNYPAGESAASLRVKAIPGSSLLGGAIQGYPLALAYTVTTIPGLSSIPGPDAMTTDGNNLYWADSATSTIWKMPMSTGAMSVVAGSGSAGSADGVGAAASFWNPTGITTDGANLYVADNGNATIRKIVIATGAVTTLAGSAGVIGATDGTGTAARFSMPWGITTDGANLYVTDAFNNNVRKVVISTAQVTTFATGFSQPTAIAMDQTNLYVADRLNRTIDRVALGNGAVTILAGSTGVFGTTDGTGTSALFTWLEGVTSDGTNLYVVDNSVIRKIVTATAAVTTPLAGWTAAPGITTDGLSLFAGGSITILKIQ